MKAAIQRSRRRGAVPDAGSVGFSSSLRAFTIIELLVVLAVIAALTTLALPSIKNIRKANVMVSAGRQLVDDLGLARARAISDRTTVHVIFVPPDIQGWLFPPGATQQAQRNLKLAQRLLSAPYTTYALYAERTVGDQPGRPQRRFITSWRTLPDGVFIATNKFINNVTVRDSDLIPDHQRNFEYVSLPFPTVFGSQYEVPHIGFDAQGRLVDKNNKVQFRNEVIPLARGSILYTRNGPNLVDFDVRETPPNNSVDNFHHVVVDSLTGRARVETPQIQ
jgi:prepilin-type N-terminal cleavage/methylation domain-containing protein